MLVPKLAKEIIGASCKSV